MKAEHVETFHQAMPAVHAAGMAGIDWKTLFQWFLQYGVPLVLQVLTLVLPLLSGEKKISLQAAIKWVGEALAALSEGKPLPPLPAVPA